MARAPRYAAIDIGTTKVCTLVGHVNDTGEVEIAGVGVAPARGLQKGMVVNIEEASDAIRTSVHRAERTSGVRISSAHVGITGNHLNSANHRGTITLSHSDRLVSEEDVARVMEAARSSFGVPNNREIIHVLPRTYLLDGQEGINNPIGLHGFRLDVDTHIVMGAITSIQNLTKCVEQTGVAVKDLVLQPLASGEAVITDDERDTGVLLVDIGGGTTDIAIFCEGSIGHTAVIPIGGYQFTHDLVVGLRVPFVAAENAKIKYGTAETELVGDDEEVEVEAFGEDSKQAISRKLMSEILRARTDELLELIYSVVLQSGYQALLPAGVIFTGGGACLHGLVPVTRHTLGMPARVGAPLGVTGLSDTIAGPAYGTSVGLLLWAARYGEDAAAPVDGFSLRRWLQNLMNMFKGKT